MAAGQGVLAAEQVIVGIGKEGGVCGEGAGEGKVSISVLGKCLFLNRRAGGRVRYIAMFSIVIMLQGKGQRFALLVKIQQQITAGKDKGIAVFSGLRQFQIGVLGNVIGFRLEIVLVIVSVFIRNEKGDGGVFVYRQRQLKAVADQSNRENTISAFLQFGLKLAGIQKVGIGIVEGCLDGVVGTFGNTADGHGQTTGHSVIGGHVQDRNARCSAANISRGGNGRSAGVQRATGDLDGQIVVTACFQSCFGRQRIGQSGSAIVIIINV